MGKVALGGKVVARGDHWVICRGRRYWNIWIGDPLSVTQYQLPLKEKSLDELVTEIRRVQKQARRWWKHHYPRVPWKYDPVTGCWGLLENVPKSVTRKSPL